MNYQVSSLTQNQIAKFVEKYGYDDIPDYN